MDVRGRGSPEDPGCGTGYWEVCNPHAEPRELHHPRQMGELAGLPGCNEVSKIEQFREEALLRFQSRTSKSWGQPCGQEGRQMAPSGSGPCPAGTASPGHLTLLLSLGASECVPAAEEVASKKGKTSTPSCTCPTSYCKSRQQFTGSNKTHHTFSDLI